MKEAHYYLAPSCGSVPESLRHWYFDDYSRDEVACIARVRRQARRQYRHRIFLHIAGINAYFNGLCARCGMVIPPERESARNAAENAK